MMPINRKKVEAEVKVGEILWPFTLNLSLNLNLVIEERGRPVSTGVLIPSVHVELSGSRKSSGKM